MSLVQTNAGVRLSAWIDLISSLSHRPDPLEALDLLAGNIRPGNGLRAVVRISTAALPAGQYCITNIYRENDSPDAPVRFPTPSIQSGGFIAELVRSPSPKIVHHLHQTPSPNLPAPIALYHSVIATPVFVEGVARDFVAVFDSRPEAFGVEDLEELVLRAALVSGAINNLHVTRQLCLANLKVRKEIEQIAAIQRALLPETLPEIPGVRLSAHYAPVLEAGGDMYDVVPLGNRPGHTHRREDERWAFLVGDVCGHGASAAVVMAMFHSILHAYPDRPEGPAEVLAHVNKHLCAKRIGRAFVTAFLAFYEPATRALTYCRAGHNPPLLFGADGARLYLDEVGDLPLGIDGEAELTETTLHLRAGQTLLLYTDGITEASDEAGAFFETAGIERVAGRGGPEGVVRSIAAAVKRHEGAGSQVDDQTLVAFEFV